MFNTSDAIPRADISTVLMEAMGQEGLFIGQSILPIYTSPTEVGRYPKFPKKESQLLRGASDPTDAAGTFSSSTRRNDTGTYNEVERKFTWDNYQTVEYGLEERVDDTVARRMANFFDAEVVTGKLLARMLMVDYELQVASTINNSTTFTATNSATAWTAANIATMDVPRDINECVERLTAVGERPDTMVMSLTIFNLIRRSQKLQAYLYGYLNTTQGGSNVTAQMIAQCFGLKRVLVSEASVDVAAKGLTASLSPIWGNTYVSLMRTGEGDFMSGGVGRTIVWDSDSPGGLFTSESYRDETRRGTKIRVRSNRVLKILLPSAAQLITTQFS